MRALKNVINDAKSMTDKFRDLGFDVSSKFNVALHETFEFLEEVLETWKADASEFGRDLHAIFCSGRHRRALKSG